MKKLRDITEGNWMYHGTPQQNIDHLKPDRGEYMLDRAIGSHFAANKDISTKFQQGMKNGQAGSAQGSLYKTRSPHRSNLEVVHQQRYAGGLESDQHAIGAHVSSTVFSQPQHKELFKSWAKRARNIDDDTAEKLHSHLSSGKAPADQKTFGTAASKGSNSFRSYMSNFDSGLSIEPHKGFREKVVNHYLNIMNSKGKHGLVYKNTSPMETQGIDKKRSNKSYVIFNPEHLNLHKEE